MEKKTIVLTIGAIISLVAAMSGGYLLSPDDDAYYCESRNMVMICEKISSGIGTRCYFEDTYKICKEGWKEIEMGQEIKPGIPDVSKGSKWLCSPEECVRPE